VWELFVEADPAQDPCLQVVEGASYWGGVCPSGSSLVGRAPFDEWVLDKRVLVGIAGNATTQLRIVDAQRESHVVMLSPDKGFIYFCQGSCGCEIAAVIATAPGQRKAAVDDLRDPATHRLIWCSTRS
jgi:hypothetical protein